MNTQVTLGLMLLDRCLVLNMWSMKAVITFGEFERPFPAQRASECSSVQWVVLDCVGVCVVLEGLVALLERESMHMMEGQPIVVQYEPAKLFMLCDLDFLLSVGKLLP